MANAPDRTALGQAQKIGLAPAQQGHQLLTDQALAFVKIRQGTSLGVAVPGAHQLAIVATVNAIAHQRAQVQRDGARVLYRQVRDAAPGVKPVRRHDGLGRANVNAGAATAAMGRHGLAGRQCQVHINLAQEKHGAGLAVEQQGVFAAPTLAAARCQLGLQHRRRIGKHPVAKGPNRRRNVVAQPLQALPQHLVVIPPTGVKRHNGLVGALQAG